MQIPISIFKTAPQGTTAIDISEAFNIFNLLSARQASVLGHQFFLNYVHDRDFVLLLESHLTIWQEQISELEKQAEIYNLKTPRRTPANLKFTANLDDITDFYIFDLILNELTAEVYSLSRAVISTTTNDMLHDIITKHFLSHIKQYGTLYKYGNTKGWMQILPSFKTEKSLKNEPITVAEANNIWDHLVERYDQWRLTQFYLSNVHDKEFKAVLQSGVTTLEDQMKTLEQLCEKFEIPLPDRPPLNQKVVADPEVLEDSFIYRNILTGIQGSINLHVRAAIETVRNDSLRKIFMDYLKEELAIYGSYFRYGKVKGWIRIIPTYHHL
jgi:hypothetical protein